MRADAREARDVRCQPSAAPVPPPSTAPASVACLHPAPPLASLFARTATAAAATCCSASTRYTGGLGNAGLERLHGERVNENWGREVTLAAFLADPRENVFVFDSNLDKPGDEGGAAEWKSAPARPEAARVRAAQSRAACIRDVGTAAERPSFAAAPQAAARRCAGTWCR